MRRHLVAWLHLIPTLRAAQGSTGSLEGWVTDPARRGLGQVEIVVARTGLLQARLAVSSPLDCYRLEGLRSAKPGDARPRLTSFTSEARAARGLWTRSIT